VSAPAANLESHASHPSVAGDRPASPCGPAPDDGIVRQTCAPSTRAEPAPVMTSRKRGTKPQAVPPPTLQSALPRREKCGFCSDDGEEPILLWSENACGPPIAWVPGPPARRTATSLRDSPGIMGAPASVARAGGTAIDGGWGRVAHRGRTAGGQARSVSVIRAWMITPRWPPGVMISYAPSAGLTTLPHHLCARCSLRVFAAASLRRMSRRTGPRYRPACLPVRRMPRTTAEGGAPSTTSRPRWSARPPVLFGTQPATGSGTDSEC
jgi:hypothetical protein